MTAIIAYLVGFYMIVSILDTIISALSKPDIN